MKNQITIDGKIGYLNPKTGRYSWATIVSITDTHFKMLGTIKQGRQTFNNNFQENIHLVIKFLKTPSPDFKDGRPLLKYKGTTKYYLN
jgi:hypothetical protein